MGDYPGQEYKMSAYGAKQYTPVQKKTQWTQACEREEKVRRQHKATERLLEKEEEERRALAEAGKLPTEKDMSIFNTSGKEDSGHLYDKLFNAQSGFNPKLKREDRTFDKHQLNRSAEEKEKEVPTLSSSVYGRGESLELPSREHVRVQMMKHTFYRPRGTDMGE